MRFHVTPCIRVTGFDYRISHKKPGGEGVTGWYLERVRVECRAEEKTWNIPCHQWFNKNTVDPQEREYYCKGYIVFMC